LPRPSDELIEIVYVPCTIGVSSAWQFQRSQTFDRLKSLDTETRLCLLPELWYIVHAFVGIVMIPEKEWDRNVRAKLGPSILDPVPGKVDDDDAKVEREN
jgi:hypothetical protein